MRGRTVALGTGEVVMGKMKALVKSGREVRACAVDRPAPVDAKDVVIRVAYAGLCRTDLWAAEGRLRTADPVVLGHELSGVVFEAGEGVTRVRAGERVTVEPFVPCGACRGCARGLCSARAMLGVDRDGAFADLLRVPEGIVHALPSGMSLRSGAYVEPVSASLAVARALDPSAGRGIVLGRGRVAELTSRVLRARGFDLDVGDPSGSPEPYAFAVETSASTESLRVAIASVERGGTVVLKSRDRASIGFSIGDAVAKELTLRAVEHAPFPEAIALLASGALAVDDLLGDAFGLDDHARAFARARESEATKVLFAIDPELA